MRRANKTARRSLSAVLTGVVIVGLAGAGLARSRATDDGPVKQPTTQSAQAPSSYGLGRTATAEEIRRWDIDIMPDGTGLPPGSGTVAQGAAIYAAKCAVCHGATGTEGPFDVLVGRIPNDSFPFGQGRGGPSTIGNYWPYATTLYDFLNRTMPFDAPGTLEADEIYSLVAVMLHWNEIIEQDAVMNAETLAEVIMPARDRFVPDNRKGGPEIR